jgi:1-acyl-sn-glycerol-3-phosphate acyltransferase
MKWLFGVLFAVICFWRWPRLYRRYVDKVTTSGYIGKPSPTVMFFARLLCRFMTWVWVGRVRVIGEENLHQGERVIVTPNHSSLLDAIMMYAKMSRDVWAIGADDVLKKCFGIIGIIATKMRTMPVDRSHGSTVIEPATNLVVRGKSLLMFPEGRISPSGVLLPYKKGAAVIGRLAIGRLRAVGENVRLGIVTTAIIYNRRDPDSALNYFKMGFKWRKGATIVYCPPIWLDELDDLSIDAVMDLVHAKMEAALTTGKAA